MPREVSHPADTLGMLAAGPAFAGGGITIFEEFASFGPFIYRKHTKLAYAGVDYL